MQERSRRALGIAAVVLQLGMPGLALAHAAADAPAEVTAAIATWLSNNFSLQVRSEDPHPDLVWPINIAALRYRGLASHHRRAGRVTRNPGESRNDVTAPSVGNQASD